MALDAYLSRAIKDGNFRLETAGSAHDELFTKVFYGQNSSTLEDSFLDKLAGANGWDAKPEIHVKAQYEKKYFGLKTQKKILEKHMKAPGVDNMPWDVIEKYVDIMREISDTYIQPLEEAQTDKNIDLSLNQDNPNFYVFSGSHTVAGTRNKKVQVYAEVNRDGALSLRKLRVLPIAAAAISSEEEKDKRALILLQGEHIKNYKGELYNDLHRIIHREVGRQKYFDDVVNEAVAITQRMQAKIDHEGKPADQDSEWTTFLPQLHWGHDYTLIDIAEAGVTADGHGIRHDGNPEKIIRKMGPNDVEDHDREYNKKLPYGRITQAVIDEYHKLFIPALMKAMKSDETILEREGDEYVLKKQDPATGATGNELTFNHQQLTDLVDDGFEFPQGMYIFSARGALDALKNFKVTYVHTVPPPLVGISTPVEIISLKNINWNRFEDNALINKRGLTPSTWKGLMERLKQSNEMRE